MQRLPLALGAMLPLLLLLLPHLAQTASSGFVEVCDTDADWGCTQWDLDEAGYADRLKCNDTKPGIMAWAARPANTDMYTVRAGDGSVGTDADKYSPGDISSIYVRTHSADYKYRGLLVYALDASGKAVGEWVIASESNAKFHSPPCSGRAAGSTLLHVSAEIKPFMVRLLWRAPAAGAGTVTFKALVKRGPANHGWFYIPNNGNLLSLTEGSEAAQHWFVGEKAKSCDDVCRAQGKSCNADSARGMTSADTFQREVGRSVACPLPLVAGCASYSPGKDKRGMCSYRDQNCEADFSCAAAPTDSRLCPCGAQVTPPDNGAPPVNGTSPAGAIASSAGQKSPSLLVLVLLAFASSLLSPRSHSKTLLLVGLCVCLVVPASAHNWLHTPGRAFRQASTIRPCLGRKPSDLHAQVGPGQEMVFKWATGHNGNSWIVTVAGEDAANLADPDFVKILQDYIDKAPANSNKALTSPRVHGATQSRFDSATAWYSDTAWYSAKLDSTANDWLDHPEAKTQVLFRYNPAKLVNDYRISYKSTVYPWLLAVYKFPHLTHLPSDYDAFKMSLPSFAKPGHHIVHWRWNGYYDCVDVDYRTTQVANIYGASTGTFVYNRQDHCQYVEPDAVTTNCYDATYGAERCFKDQQTTATNRYGINIVPITNPDTVAAAARAHVNIPWNNPTCANNAWTKFTGGIMSESATTWAKWQARSTTTAGRTCEGAGLLKQQTSTLAQAVIDCSVLASGCAGVSWETAKGVLPSVGEHLFRLCKDLTAPSTDALWTVAAKKNFDVAPVVGTTLTYHFAREQVLKTLDTSGLSGSEFVAAQNIFGAGGKKYGWKCAHMKGGGNLGDTVSVANQYLNVASSCGENALSSCVANFCNKGTSITEVSHPNNWEAEVPNGFYEVTIFFARAVGSQQSHAIRDCHVEGHRVSATDPPATTADQSRFSATVVVEVSDGRLTLGGVPVVGSRLFFACTNVNKLEVKPIGPKYTPAWMPSRTSAWTQMKLEKSSKVGLVTIKNRAYTDCGSWWLFRGDSCFDKDSAGGNRPLGQFPSANDGAVVGVSNTPCSGDACTGTVCGRVDFPTRHDRPDFSVDCKGATGQYVYVHLPGPNRIIAIQSITVNKVAPEAAPGTYVCYGVEARPQTETEPEYLVSDDPEDPMFYSTCYVREKNTTWLPTPADVETKDWHFSGRCVDCESYKHNDAAQTRYGFMGTPKWTLKDKCYDCDDPATTIAPAVGPAWVVKATGAKCDFNTRNTCNDPTNTLRCEKELFLQDGTQPRTVEQCEAASTTATGCSKTYQWYQSTNGATTKCSCYLAESCCGECTPLASNGYTLWTKQTNPDPTCITGVKDAAGKLCCEATCMVNGASVCGTSSCRSTSNGVRGACCADYTVPKCTVGGPPCTL